MAAAGGEEVGTNVTRDVVAATSVFSVKHLWGGWVLQRLKPATIEERTCIKQYHSSKWQHNTNEGRHRLRHQRDGEDDPR